MSVVLDPDEHDIQLTDLVLVEAPDDIIQPTLQSLTHEVDAGRIFLPVTGIDDIVIVEPREHSLEFMKELFALADRTTSATDPGNAQAVLAKYAGQNIGLRVAGNRRNSSAAPLQRLPAILQSCS